MDEQKLREWLFMAYLLHLSRLRRLCALFLCRVSCESNGPSRRLSNFFFFYNDSASPRLGAGDQCFVFSSIFFLEAYHSEGAGEAWGWLGAICFKLAAFAGMSPSIVSLCHRLQSSSFFRGAANWSSCKCLCCRDCSASCVGKLLVRGA